MAISLRLNKEDTELIKKYDEFNHVTVSELIRRTVLERIEDDYDLKTYKKAMEEHKKNPVTHTLAEIEKELNLVWSTV